jgi:GntR family transcriptional regulator
MAKPKTTFVSSRIPLYYQLENVLREKITSGNFEAGDRIPTELELIEEYGVSRITVRQALQALAEEGLIERKQGRGTVVAVRKSRKKRFSGTIHLTGSLDELIKMGMDTPVKVLEMKRLRMNEGKPFGLIVNYLPEEIGAALTMAELSSGALLHTMETKLGYRLDNAIQQIHAELADPYVAKILDVRVGTALLSIERTVYTDKNKPVEYVHTLYRSDLYGYSVKLVRDKPRNGGTDEIREEKFFD